MEFVRSGEQTVAEGPTESVESFLTKVSSQLLPDLAKVVVSYMTTIDLEFERAVLQVTLDQISIEVRKVAARVISCKNVAVIERYIAAARIIMMEKPLEDMVTDAFVSAPDNLRHLCQRLRCFPYSKLTKCTCSDPVMN